MPPALNMGAGISVRNESEISILAICSQLTPLHWGKVDPGMTWNGINPRPTKVFTEKLNLRGVPYTAAVNVK